MSFPKCRQYPKGITVKDMFWEIKFCRRTPDQPATDLGLCDPEDRTIYIRYRQDPREMFMTLFHEWLHAVENEYEIEISHKIIEVLEEAVANFCEENDEIMVWFLFSFLEGEAIPR